MSDEPVKIEVDDRELYELMNRMLAGLQNMEPLMQGVSDMLVTASRDLFKAEAGPDGTAWQDLADSTKARREKKGKWPGKKLQVDGALKAVQPAYGPNWAQVGSNLRYSRIHFFGGQAGRGKKTTIPARPYLPISAEGTLSEKARDRILNAMIEYVNNMNYAG